MGDSARHARNLGAITAQEQQLLQNSRVCIIGCGGLGGFLAEFLGRMGVGSLTLVDGDRFSPTNLNRQLVCTSENLGFPKADETKKRLLQIDPGLQITAIEQFLTPENAAAILAGHHLVMDALDSIPHRLVLQRVCKELQIPLVHGAVESWFGQVATVFPGDDTLSRLYPGWKEDSIPQAAAATLSFAPAAIASLQAAEAAKVLIGKESTLRGKVLFVDLLASRFDIMPL